MWVAACLITAGCGLERPETPSFETTFHVPIQEQSYTGQDMAGGLQATEGDTSAPGPLAIHLREQIEPVALEGKIRLEVVGQSYSADIERIAFRAPFLPPVSFDLVSILPDSVLALGGARPIGAFTFGLPAAELGDVDHFSLVTFESGTLLLTVVNNLPIPVGGGGQDQALRVRLTDRSTHLNATVLEWVVAGELEPGAGAQLAKDLAGSTFPNRLGVEISGWSSGSDGAPVDLGSGGALDLELAFGDLEVARLDGRLPALCVETEAQVTLAGGCSVAEAVVSEGSLMWLFESHLPVAVTLTLAAPQIAIGGAELCVLTRLEAWGSTWVNVDLAGAEMERGASAGWRWRLSAASDSAGESGEVSLGPGVTATLAAAELCFASVRGVLDHVAVDIAPLESPIEYPAGAGGVEFTAAEAEILLRNRAAVAAEASFVLWGQANGDTVRLPIAAAIAAGSPENPAETRVALREGSSAITELLGLHPAALTLSGTVAIGDGVTEGSIATGDYLDGEFTFLAPMKLVISEAHQQGEPFTVELDREVRDQVAANLLAVSIDTEVENHFPTGIAVRLHFAREEAGLFVEDDLILDADPLPAASIDARTGRVAAATTSTIVLVVSEGDIRLFAEERLYGGIEVTLLGDGEQPIEIWSTDYVKVRGVAAFRYRVK